MLCAVFLLKLFSWWFKLTKAEKLLGRIVLLRVVHHHRLTSVPSYDHNAAAPLDRLYTPQVVFFKLLLKYSQLCGTPSVLQIFMGGWRRLVLRWRKQRFIFFFFAIQGHNEAMCELPAESPSFSVNSLERVTPFKCKKSCLTSMLRCFFVLYF